MGLALTTPSRLARPVRSCGWLGTDRAPPPTPFLVSERTHLMSDVEQNKQAVVAFLQASFVDGQPEQAVPRHVGDRYIQHNPLVPDGAEPFIGFVHWLRGQHPELPVEIKHVVADGDL